MRNGLAQSQTGGPCLLLGPRTVCSAPRRPSVAEALPLPLAPVRLRLLMLCRGTACPLSLHPGPRLEALTLVSAISNSSQGLNRHLTLSVPHTAPRFTSSGPDALPAQVMGLSLITLSLPTASDPPTNPTGPVLRPDSHPGRSQRVSTVASGGTCVHLVPGSCAPRALPHLSGPSMRPTLGGQCVLSRPVPPGCQCLLPHPPPCPLTAVVGRPAGTTGSPHCPRLPVCDSKHCLDPKQIGSN